MGVGPLVDDLFQRHIRNGVHHAANNDENTSEPLGVDLTRVTRTNITPNHQAKANENEQNKEEVKWGEASLENEVGQDQYEDDGGGIEELF